MNRSFPTLAMRLQPDSGNCVSDCNRSPNGGPVVAIGDRIRSWGPIGRNLVARSSALLVFLVIWHIAALRFANPVLLPTPARVMDEIVLLARSGELGTHALASVSRLLVGYLAAFVSGIGLGILIGLSPRSERLIDPLLELVRPISAIAWIPLGLYFFGIGDILPAFIIAYAAFFPILLNTVSGVKGADRTLILAALTMGVPWPSIVRHVILPGSLPRVLTGVRLGATSAILALIAAELVGAPAGLGFAIQWFGGILDTPSMLAFIVVVSALGFVSDILLRALQRVLTPWDSGSREAR
jgi:ABC-type nitrate/sulfonate/bicarbonate transport system permease component